MQFIHWLLAFLFARSVQGTFFPVSLRREVSGLERRRLQDSRSLQPSPSVELYYMEEYISEIPYLVRVTASHNQSQYIIVEQFEHLLVGFECSPRDNRNITSMTFAFDTLDSFADARTAWEAHETLLFVTHHMTCNEAETRSVYKSSVIIYDSANLAVMITATFVELGASNEATSHLRITGQPMNMDLRKKLRRRNNIEDVSRQAKRQAKNSQWVFDLGDFGKFDPREDIISFDQLKMACVNCGLNGKVVVMFDLDINFDDLLKTPFDGDINPFNTAKVELRILEAIHGNFNVEVQATATGRIECSFPGTCNRNFKQGRKFSPGMNRTTSSIAGIDVTASLNLGVAVGLDWKAQAKVTFPVIVDAPAGGAISKDFFGNGATSNTLDIKPRFDSPVISRDDAVAQVCGYIALGPAVVLDARTNRAGTNAGVTLTARLDLPRVTICAALAQNVNGKCMAGPFSEAIKLSANIGAGLMINGKAFLDFPGPVDPPPLKINLTPNGLYKTWDIAAVCFDISNGKKDGDYTIPLDPDQPKDSDTPSDPNFGLPPNNHTAGGGYENGLYNCGSVAPSPGGQPCGNVIMKCLDSQHWSCGNGQEGVVPPGTFCACGAFRYPGWLPPAAVSPSCTKGIVCVSEKSFSVCSPAGIEPPQAVSPGTKCLNGELVAA